MTDREYPHNLEAEENVLGAMILSSRHVPTMVASLAAGDFYRIAHQTLFTSISHLYEHGAAINEVTLSNELKRRGALETIGGSAALITLQANTADTTVAGVRSCAGIVREHASLRKLIAIGNEVVDAAYKREDPAGIAEQFEEGLRHLDRGTTLPDRYWSSTADYLAAPKGELGEPVVRGVIAARSRTLVVATEKSGKSFALKQLGAVIAAGLHPWDFSELPEPQSVLFLDAENDDDENEKTLGYLDTILTARLGPDFTRPAILSRPYGMNLRSRRDRTELEDVLDAVRPRVVIGGPVYKLTERRDRESEDDRSGALQRILDDIRRRFGCALILEHHAPTGTNGTARELRSKGGQQWDAWVNATIALHAKDGGQRLEVRHVHPPRGRVVWPKHFIRGTADGDWPWIPSWRPVVEKSEQYEPPERAEQGSF